MGVLRDSFRERSVLGSIPTTGQFSLLTDFDRPLPKPDENRHPGNAREGVERYSCKKNIAVEDVKYWPRDIQPLYGSKQAQNSPNVNK